MSATLINAVKCLTCGVIIESQHRHDFRSCRCKNEKTAVAVDGGSAYMRRVFGPEAKWVELVAVEPGERGGPDA
jgi:hypothetical protein